jgi:hypothetical protein
MSLTEPIRSWLPHDGGDCPVAPDADVDIMTRGGDISTMRAGAVVWRWGSFIGEILETMPAEAEVVGYRYAEA